MGMKQEIVQLAQDVAQDPKNAGAAGTAMVAGLSTVLEWVSAGVGLAASVAGLLLAVMMIRKARLESELLRERLRQIRGDDDAP